jgi:hypothetical protein
MSSVPFEHDGGRTGSRMKSGEEAEVGVPLGRFPDRARLGRPDYRLHCQSPVYNELLARWVGKQALGRLAVLLVP